MMTSFNCLFMRRSSSCTNLIATQRSGRWLVAPPLPAQLRPVVQPLPDLALEAALGRVVEGFAAELVGKIVLTREGIRRVVVVVVARAIPLLLHQPGRRIQDMLGRQQ